ncbi:hypothetical protein SGPA1_21171 [Streptomyces misionensis JCM 4497]
MGKGKQVRRYRLPRGPELIGAPRRAAPEHTGGFPSVPDRGRMHRVTGGTRPVSDPAGEHETPSAGYARRDSSAGPAHEPNGAGP